VNTFEVPDAEDIYFYERYSTPAGACSAPCGTSARSCPLAIAGIVLTWQRRRELTVLYVVLGTLAAGVVLFYVFARLPLSARARSDAVRGRGTDRRSRQFPRAAVGTSSRTPWSRFALAWCASNLPHTWSRDDGLGDSYQNSGLVLVQQGDPPARDRDVQQSDRSQTERARARANFGFALLQSGRSDEAIAAFRRELEMNPPDRRALRDTPRNGARENAEARRSACTLRRRAAHRSQPHRDAQRALASETLTSVDGHRRSRTCAG
jgi:tetratricopeptide (TPR) repeat protein